MEHTRRSHNQGLFCVRLVPPSHLEHDCSDILSRPVTSRNQQSMPLLPPDSLGALAVNSKIRGFFQGVTGAITGHLPGGHDRKTTAARKTVRARKRSTGRTSKAKRLKTRRVGSRTNRNTGLRKKPKPVEPLTDRSMIAPAAPTTVYTCPTCGLEADKALMLEHLLGSPLHQPGRVPVEQLTDRKAEEQPTLSRDEDSSDSLRNLLQILLPPRPFGRRHEQKTVKL